MDVRGWEGGEKGERDVHGQEGMGVDVHEWEGRRKGDAEMVLVSVPDSLPKGGGSLGGLVLRLRWSVHKLNKQVI